MKSIKYFSFGLASVLAFSACSDQFLQDKKNYGQVGEEILDYYEGADTEKQKVSDWSLKTANISGNAGLALMFANHLQVSVNYNFALSKNAEYKVIKNGIENHVKVKNNAWQIALAYYF